jgi:hypothetical protein
VPASGTDIGLIRLCNHDDIYGFRDVLGDILDRSRAHSLHAWQIAEYFGGGCGDHAGLELMRISDSIGGNLSGLLPGRSVTLLDNPGDALTLTATGAFIFDTQIASGSSYGVIVGTQPVGENCTATAGTGSVDAINVKNVGVDCVATAYLIGGKLSGLLPGGSVVLLNNAGDSLTLIANGFFTFATPLPPGST